MSFVPSRTVINRPRKRIASKAAIFLTVMVIVDARSVHAQTSSCNSTAVNAINSVLSGLTPILNTAWPSLAVSNDLDPLNNVFDGDVDIGCEYGGDEICAAELAECKKEYLEVDVESITGLSYLQFEDLTVTSCSTGSGNQACPFDSSATAGAYSSSYSGQASGKAYLISGEQLSAKLTDMKFKVKCSDGLTSWNNTLWSGSATCTGKNPEGSADFNYCGGACQSSSPPVVLSYGALDALNIKLGSLECDVSPSYDPVSWIAEALVPALEKTIVNAVTPPIEEALNELLAEELPFPAICSSGG